MARTACRRVLPAALAARRRSPAFRAGVHELAPAGRRPAPSAAPVVRGCRPPAPDGVARGLAAAAVPEAPAGRCWRLFRVFLEIGAVLYGSGYVLLAFLQRRLVDDLGWITAGQLLDAVTVGQVTPGPVFTTATFVGWQVDGPPARRWPRSASSCRRSCSWPSSAGWSRGSGPVRCGGGAPRRDGGVPRADGRRAGRPGRRRGSTRRTVTVAAGAGRLLVRTRLNSAWLVGAGALVGLGLVHALAT